MSSSQKGARGRALQDLSVPLFLRSLSRINSSSKYIREKLTAQMKREYRSGSTDARECVVLKHAAAKVTLQACEKSVYQSGFLYKVVVMSDANLGCSRDGQLRIGVGAATREGTTLHSASDCGPKPCAERRHTQAIHRLSVRSHIKGSMLRAQPGNKSWPTRTDKALFQFNFFVEV
jgi:disulfide oxidoreductase YuzD